LCRQTIVLDRVAKVMHDKMTEAVILNVGSEIVGVVDEWGEFSMQPWLGLLGIVG